MRTLALPFILVFAVAFTGGCKESDPNKFETHLERIKDPEKRNTGFNGLEKLVKTVAGAPNNEERLQKFADEAVPLFVEVWDESDEQHGTMLTILRDAGHPAGCPVWKRALPLDGSAEARKETLLALEGIKKAESEQCAEPVVAELKKLVENPKHDQGKEAGRVRLEMVDTLGELEAEEAVPVLIEVMEQTKKDQPVAVHRAAATALGNIADPGATEALLTVTFRVPDKPSTSDIGNRSKLALVSIGDPAVGPVLDMLRGEFEPVNELAIEHNVDLRVVKQTAAGILGAMGTEKATEELIAFMPKEDCGEGGADIDPAKASLRAFVAQALGFIGDERAVKPLCGCVHATHNPGDMWEIVQALGRIGGDAAVECLVDVVKTGEYDPKYLENPEFRYEIRWEGARFAILAARPDDLAEVEAALKATKDPKVQKRMEAWKPGIEVLEECKKDQGCYLKVLRDASAEWFAREKAAFELARLAEGDREIAVEIAKAFKVRNPDARVSMAWLPAQMLEGKKCPKCVEAYNKVLEAEKGSMDATMQLPVLTARNTIAKLTPHRNEGGGGPPTGGEDVAAGAAEGKAAEGKAEEG